MAPENARRREKTVHEPDPAPASGADPAVLDLDHLARYTVGNRDLERELLRLFRTQMRAQVTAIAEAGNAEDWRFATHTLKGVARSIGAWSIAETAEELERLGHAGDRGEYARLMVALAARIAACEREIERVMAR